MVLKKNILLDYLTKIKMKVDLSKKRAIKEFVHRHDHEMIKCITHKEAFVEDHLAKQKNLVTKVLEKNDFNNNSDEIFEQGLIEIDDYILHMNIKTNALAKSLKDRKKLEASMDEKMQAKLLKLKGLR